MVFRFATRTERPIDREATRKRLVREATPHLTSCLAPYSLVYSPNYTAQSISSKSEYLPNLVLRILTPIKLSGRTGHRRVH